MSTDTTPFPTANGEKILVFIPAYCCAAQIARVLKQFEPFEVNRRFDEILVLDNQSPDQTIQAAANAAQALGMRKITIARNCDNYGLGGSHKAAFHYAIRNGFSHIVVLHGDDQGNIADLLPWIDSRAHDKHECLLGARFHPQARLQGYSLVRRAGNLVFNALFSIVGGKRLYDLGAGLNMYRVETLGTHYWRHFDDNLMFNYCMILAHVARGDRMLFFPISWREDDQVSNVRLFSQAWRTLKMLYQYAVDRAGFLGGNFNEGQDRMYEFTVVAKKV